MKSRMVLVGCEPSAGSGTDVVVNPGAIVYDGAIIPFPGGTVTLDAADPSLDRYDLVAIDDTGTLQKTDGDLDVYFAPTDEDLVAVAIGEMLAGSSTVGTVTDVRERPAIVGQTLVHQLGLFDLNVKQFGAVGDGSTDDTVSIQAALDTAAAMAAANGGLHVRIYFPAGDYHITDTLQWSAGILEGSYVDVGANISWDGPTDGTMIERVLGAVGGGSYWGIRDLGLSHGANDPGTFLDLTPCGIGVDKFGRLDHVQMSQCTGDAVKVPGYDNLHWTDLRFDSIGGYAIAVTYNGTEDNVSFLLERFTYTNNSGAIAGKGLLGLDNSAGGGVGPVTVEHGRIEVDSTLSGNKALVDYALGGSVGSHALFLTLRGLAVAINGALTDHVVFYRDTTPQGHTDGQAEFLTLDYMAQLGFSNIVGGDWGAPTPILKGFYMGGDQDTYGSNVGFSISSAPSVPVFDGYGPGDTEPRIRLTHDPYIQLGDGSHTPDITIFRDVPGPAWRTNESFIADDGLVTLIKAGTVSDADFANPNPRPGLIGIDETNHRLYVRFSDGSWHYATLT